MRGKSPTAISSEFVAAPVILARAFFQRREVRRASIQERRRPLERDLIAVSWQIGRRRIRVAFLGTVEFADLAQVDLR
jgi:hypothetical protein